MNIQNISIVNDKSEYINVKNVELDNSLVQLHENQHL